MCTTLITKLPKIFFTLINYVNVGGKMSTESVKLRPYTTFYHKCFLWRTKITVNGQPLQVGQEENEPITLKSTKPKVEIPFSWFVDAVHKILRRRQLPDISKFWYEKAPLFLLDVSCSEDLKKLFSSEDEIQEEVALELRCKLESELKGCAPDVTDTCSIYVPTYIY